MRKAAEHRVIRELPEDERPRENDTLRRSEFE